MEKVQPQTSYSSRPGQVISLEKGKLPPQAVDLEEVVLGAMMIDKKGSMMSSTFFIQVFSIKMPINIFLKPSIFFSKAASRLTY